MTIASTKSLARWSGFAIGLAVAAWLILLGRVSENSRVPGTQLTMVTKPTDTLMIEPAGKSFISARDLRPGPASRGAHGSFEVVNLARTPVSVAVAGRPSSRDLDQILQIDIEAEGERVFRGRLGDLRSFEHRFRLGVSQRKELQVRAWLPASAGNGSHGRFVDVSLEWRTRGVRS